MRQSQDVFTALMARSMRSFVYAVKTRVGPGIDIAVYPALIYRPAQNLSYISAFIRFNAVTQNDNHSEQDLVGLGTASRMLGVEGATLRNWANRGLVRVVRTPGGHRRFFREEIQSLSERNAPPPMAERQHWEELALKRIKRRLRRDGRGRHVWRDGFAADDLVRFRLFGRRVLSLLARTVSEGVPRQMVMQEAHLLGRENGKEMFSQEHSLTNTLSAFLFFRDGALEALPSDSRQRALAVADQIMLGVAEAHQEWVEKEHC